MKNTLALIITLLLSTAAFSQVGRTEMTLSNLQLTQIDLDQKSETFGLNELELSKMEGSPYANSTFSIGNIYKGDELVKKSVLLRYNALAKQIEMKNNNLKSDSEYGALIKDLDIYATIEGKTYRLLAFENSVENGDYYEVISKGTTYDLFKKTNVNFVKPFVAKTSYEKDRPAKFEQSHTYYLSSTKDGKLTELPSSNRKLMKFLSAKDKDIKDFFKTNKIDCDEEKDLIKVITRYDNLF